MVRQRLSLILAILVFGCAATLAFYFYRLRMYTPLPPSVFWAAFMVAVISIMVQVGMGQRRVLEPVLFAEILALGVTLQQIYIIPFTGPQNTDATYYAAIIKRISAEATVEIRSSQAQGVSAWPLFMIWAAQLQSMTGISIINLLKFIPSLFVSPALVLLLYLFARRIFSDRRIPPLAMLLTVTINYFIWEGSVFKSEFYAWILMLTGILFMVNTDRGHRAALSSLFVFCLFAVIVAHHLTSFIMLLFLIVFWVSTRMDRLPLARMWRWSSATMVVSTSILLLGFAGVFFYWLYIYDTPLRIAVETARTVLHGQPGQESLAEAAYVLDPQTIISARGKIMFWGYYVFHAAFAVVLLYGMLTSRKEKEPGFYALAFLLIGMGVWGAAQLYAMPPKTPGILGLERTVMLGWFWGFPPLIASILTARWVGLRFAGLALLIGFTVFNVYVIPPSRWDGFQPDREASMITAEDYALAGTLSLSEYGATPKAIKVAYLMTRGTNPFTLYDINVERLRDVDWIGVRKQESKKLMAVYPELLSRGRTQEMNVEVTFAVAALLTDSSAVGRNRIYESKNIILFSK